MNRIDHKEDSPESRDQIQKFVESEREVLFTEKPVDFNIIGRWIINNKTKITIDCDGHIIRDGEDGHRELIMVKYDFIKISYLVQADPRYEIQEGYNSEFYRWGYVNHRYFVIWNGDGSLIKAFERIL